jgi:deoxyribonuclease-1
MNAAFSIKGFGLISTHERNRCCMCSKKCFLLICVVWFSSIVQASQVESSGNQKFDSFRKVKRIMMKSVYVDHRFTLYCRAPFNARKWIDLPLGFVAPKHQKRAKHVEFEHVVPAENFGRSFKAWRQGDPRCIHRNGRVYKGRKCLTKVSQKFRLMQADMYNIYPAVGAVNAMRSNYNFTQMAMNVPATFGSCSMKIQGRKVEPPVTSRGMIARSYLYMESVYHEFQMSVAQRKLMKAWDQEYPVKKFECIRYRRIFAKQKNDNPIMQSRCMAKGW